MRALRRAVHDPRMRVWLLATLVSGAAVDALLVYQVPVMVRIGLPLALAAAVAGFRSLSQLAGRLPLSPLIRRLGTRDTIVLSYVVAACAMPLLFLPVWRPSAEWLPTQSASAFGEMPRESTGPPPSISRQASAATGGLNKNPWAS